MTEANETQSSVIVQTDGDRELIITRNFDASAQSVFDALTRPEKVSQWFGEESGLLECTIDLREGASYRFVTAASDGSRHAFSGRYKAIEPPHRLVYTERYEQMAGAESVVSVQLEETNGRTLLTERIEYASGAARDGHLASGMEHGASAAFNRLANLLD